MATIKFLLQSKSDNAPIYLRFSVSRDNVFYRKTGLYINPKKWGKGMPKDKNATRDIKDLITELKGLETEILKNYNRDNTKGIVINGDWLINKIDIHFKRISETSKSELVTDAIQNIIDNAHIRDNGKGGIGLSKCRVSAYNRLLQLFSKFQNKKQYKLKELDKAKFNNFKKWLLDKNGYSASYSLKKLSDLKTVCKDARSNGIETSTELTDIKTKQSTAYDDDMDVIYLTPQEIEKIEKATLLREAHINARKWLILACYTGQRGGDLIKITESNFKKTKEIEKIELTQQKTNKKVEIPILPKVKEIFENGLPYKVSTQKLNKYFKEVGEIAEINTPVMGRIIEASENPNEKKKRGVKKMRPKYSYISTHIGRRSFASNHYGKIPTPIIMKVTGHKKESTFLTYINNDDDSHIEAFLKFYKKEEQRNRKESNLKAVKKAN